MDLVLVGSNLPHHWVSVPNGEDQIAHVFQFGKDLFIPFEECQSFKQLFDQAQRGLHFKNISKQVIQDMEAFEHYDALERLSALINLIGKLLKHPRANPLASKEYRVRREKTSAQIKFSRINNYILEHLNTKLTVQEVSEVAHMVPQSFCRWFKQHSGHSFISFVNITRIETACQLLLTADLPIQEIAFSSGFESLSHFNRTFKKLKGRSPREFKTLNQKTS